MTMTDTGLKHTTLRAEGFTCPSCIKKIEKQVGKLKGVESVEVKYASSKVEVSHDPQVSVDDLVAAVSKAGYKSAPSVF